MVRIIDGKIVSDEEARTLQLNRNQTNFEVQRAYKLFPSTQKKFGVLSNSLLLAGFEVEVFWLFILGISAFCFGFKGMLLIGFLSVLFQYNQTRNV